MRCCYHLSDLIANFELGGHPNNGMRIFHQTIAEVLEGIYFYAENKKTESIGNT